MSNARVTRVKYDTYDDELEVTVSRRLGASNRPKPSDIPVDLREALLHWLVEPMTEYEIEQLKEI